MNKNSAYGSLYGLSLNELKCETIINYARALCLFIAKKTDRKPVILVGRDTRLSSEMLESAFTAGVCSAGADCINLGIVPSASVAHLISKHKADAGVMLCASVADAQHNGVRLFSSSGFYFSQKELEQIDEISKNTDNIFNDIKNEKLGRRFSDAKALWDYNRHIISQIETNLHGVKVLIDCANGSCAFTAKNIFEGLGASCTIINDMPNGNNINANCGAANTENLKKAVVDNHYALGLAFDGDGDKITVIDEKGAIVDNERLLTVFAKHYRDENLLQNNTVVCTNSTNLGVANFCQSHNINIIETKADERDVAEHMLHRKYSLGADNAGHIFFEAQTPVSDAQLTGVKLLEILVKSGKKLSELSQQMQRCSQIQLNIKISPKSREIWKNDRILTEYIEKCANELGNEARIVVRECRNDNESSIAVIIEGRNFDDINKYALMIGEKIKERVKTPKK